MMDEKVKVYIDEDERYPDFSISLNRAWDGQIEAEVSKEFVERYEKASDEYCAVQEILQGLVKDRA